MVLEYYEYPPPPVAGRGVCLQKAVAAYRIPCSTIDLATFMNPAMLAPFM